jgi:hypothetical protein
VYESAILLLCHKSSERIPAVQCHTEVDVYNLLYNPFIPIQGVGSLVPPVRVSGVLHLPLSTLEPMEPGSRRGDLPEAAPCESRPPHPIRYPGRDSQVSQPTEPRRGQDDGAAGHVAAL